MDAETVTITRTTSGLSMDDKVPMEGPAGAYNQPFHSAALDGTGIDIADSTWCEIDSTSKLFQLVSSHIVRHAESDSSFRLEVADATSDDTEKARRAAAMEAKKSHRAVLGIGLGLFRFDTEHGEIVALHQVIGEPVGSDCGGPQRLTTMVLFIAGKNKQAKLQEFCGDLLAANEVSEANSFKIFRWHPRRSYWMQDAVCRARPIESVVLPKATKEAMLGDIDDFLSEDSWEFYQQHGIPYRRSYLFHGVPGGGKTSLITAVAGKYGRNVAYLQACHPDMSDDNLMAAIRGAPARSIIVLEDIDGLFDKERKKKCASSPLTFSGLLNALDGIGNPAGQIFVLTTNFRDQLDEALIRNGRVDVHVEFTNAVDEQIAEMTRQFYPKASEEAVASLVVGLRAALNGKEISTAVVQHFFVTQRRHTVEEAIANVGAVVKDMEDREKRQQDELHDAEEEVAEKEQDEDGEEDDEDGEEDSKATVEGAAAAPEAARATVIHVHVHQHEKN
jgi:mitochondrial chaperone BCS1